MVWAASSEKSAFEHAQNAQIQNHSPHVQSLIQAFVLSSYILVSNESVSKEGRP